MVVEDSVSGSGSDYDQVNYYNTTASHPMYGLGNPIVGFKHRHVLRAILGGPWGTDNVIPDQAQAGESYTKTYTTTLTSSWKTNRIKIVGLVQKYNSDDTKREIINAVEEPMLMITNIANAKFTPFNYSIYPNPCADETSILITNTKKENINIEIFDQVGRKIFFKSFEGQNDGDNLININTKEWSSGLYIVRISGENQNYTEKLIIK
jgi:hypothetical protein